jgi:hypothetical protein
MEVSGNALAYQAQGPEFNPQHQKEKKSQIWKAHTQRGKTESSSSKIKNKAKTLTLNFSIQCSIGSLRQLGKNKQLKASKLEMKK